MFSKMIKTFAGCAVTGLIIFGCGSKAPNTPLARDGLKEVSISSTELFTGDVTLLPGYRGTGTDGADKTAAAKAQALIDFDHAYAMVFRCMGSVTGTDPSYCDVARDMFDAFGNRSPLTEWENLLAGCRQLQTKDVVSVTELEKAGDHVEGSIFVKPGINTTVVFFVLNGVITYTSVNDYINLDSWDDPDGYFSDASSGWMASMWSSGIFSASSHVGSYETGNMITLDYTQASVNSACGIPSIMLFGPDDGAVNQGTAGLYMSWYGENFSGTVTYTLYLDTANPPVTTYMTNDPSTYYYASGLLNGTTYYWKVVATDGTTTETSEVRSFTTTL